LLALRGLARTPLSAREHRQDTCELEGHVRSQVDTLRVVSIEAHMRLGFKQVDHEVGGQVASGVVASLLRAWQDCQDHADVRAELGHVAAEELSRGVVGDLAVLQEHLRGVLDVRLG